MKKIVIDRYLYLPDKYRVQHDQCVALVSQIEQFITDEKFACIRNTEFTDKEVDVAKFAAYNDDPLAYFEDNDKLDLMKIVVKQQVLFAIIVDFCYFVQEALSCSKKMRLVVTYTLLRKPFVDCLKILLRFMLDSNFIDDYINKDGYDPTRIKDNDLKDMLSAFDDDRVTNTIKGDDIYYFIFDSENPNSIVNISNKAIHPITNRSKNPRNNTERMNLNFLFANSDNIDAMWDGLYRILLPILIYYSDLLNICIWSNDRNNLSKELLNMRYEEMTKILNMN